MRLTKLIPLVLLLPALGYSPLPQTSIAWEKPLAPGLVYRMEVDTATPRQMHALRLTPSSPSLRWQTQIAGGTIEEEGTLKGRLTPTDIAAKEGALAAINGDFFTFDYGAPLGMTVREGELINTPARARAVFGWGPKDAGIATGTAVASITSRSGAGPLDAVNQPIGENGIVLYTRAQGIVTPREGAVVVMLDVPNVKWTPNTVVNAVVKGLSQGGSPLRLGEGQAVLMATGTKRSRLENLTIAQTVTIRTDSPAFDWERFKNVVGGGPFLLREGKVAIDATAEGFSTAFTNRRHPRTAIGRTAEGDVWIVAIDGRQGHSDGATLEETAVIMRRLGCTDAINLDGGGSTALHVRGLTVNRPSDGVERQVANGIVIFGPKAPAPSGKLRLVVAPRVMSDGTLDARVDLDGKPVPNIDVMWTARGEAWADPGGRMRFARAGAATLYARVYGQTLQADVEWDGK
ncbi:MAG: phosphodiester glycosidase family protein [Fimbriimonas sp.]